MAIRVIDDTPDDRVIIKVLCRKCGVKLECTPADCREFPYTDISQVTETIREIICPKCGNMIQWTK